MVKFLDRAVISLNELCLGIVDLREASVCNIEGRDLNRHDRLSPQGTLTIPKQQDTPVVERDSSGAS